MTRQVEDSCYYAGQEYSIVSLTSSIPFSPQEYGLTPHMACTACWQGWWCDYEARNEGLYLKTLYINNNDGNYPELHGVAVSPQRYQEAEIVGVNGIEKIETEADMGHRRYEEVGLALPYEGGILLGADPVYNGFPYMMMSPCLVYKNLIELTYGNGHLDQITDHSVFIRKLREKVDENREKMCSREMSLHFLVEQELPKCVGLWWI